MKILVTGSSGFIGFSLSKSLLDQGHEVIGIDNHNDYYDQKLKKSRLKVLSQSKKFKEYNFSIENKISLDKVFSNYNFDIVINLAAQAGVRFSIEKPEEYVTSNILGFLNILEACKNADISSLVYASSSSVYGGNKKIPFSEDDEIASPKNMYAVTKMTNELQAKVYSDLYGIKSVGLRFFTVYGPWGRPDMAPMKFMKYLYDNKKIQIYNNGLHKRDFTYIDDIVFGIEDVIKYWDKFKSGSSVLNIGNGNPILLNDFITTMEDVTSKSFIKEYIGIQPGEVDDTEADMSQFKAITGFSAKTPIKDGIVKLNEWYRKFYSIS